MKNIFILFFLLAFYSVNLLAQKNSFEGIIEMVQQNSNGIEYEMKWYIKNGKLAYELTTSSSRGDFNIRLVPNPSKKSVLMVTGETKIEVPSSEINYPEGFDIDNVRLENAGAGKNKHFRKVDNWKVSTENMTTSLAVTTDVDVNFSEYKEFFKSDMGLCALAESGRPGFPIDIETHDKEGNLVTKTSFKKVTRTNVSDSFFQ